MSRGISPFTRTLPTVRISGRTRTDTDEVVVREGAATIMVNNRELVTLLCSPVDLDCLAIGFLLSEGFCHFYPVDHKYSLVVPATTEVVIHDTRLHPDHSADIFNRQFFNVIR